jgi:hypothetical protein
MVNALSAEGRAQHKDVGDLWHSVLFYTSGVELRRLLPSIDAQTSAAIPTQAAANHPRCVVCQS